MITYIEIRNCAVITVMIIAVKILLPEIMERLMSGLININKYDLFPVSGQSKPIKCYQCNSFYDKGCADFFDNTTYPLIPCPINATKCRKIIQESEYLRFAVSPICLMGHHLVCNNIIYLSMWRITCLSGN